MKDNLKNFIVLCVDDKFIVYDKDMDDFMNKPLFYIDIRNIKYSYIKKRRVEILKMEPSTNSPMEIFLFKKGWIPCNSHIDKLIDPNIFMKRKLDEFVISYDILFLDNPQKVNDLISLHPIYEDNLSHEDEIMLINCVLMDKKYQIDDTRTECSAIQSIITDVEIWISFLLLP